MQLSPNSYLQLSVFLAWALQVGATIDCDDFLKFHDCILSRGEDHYFHLASKANCRFFVNKPSSHKNWKHRPLLITGKWAAPEFNNYLKIRSTFAVSASNYTTSLSQDQIQCLNTCLARSYFDIKEFSTPDILHQISQNRASTIYSLFQPEHLKPGVEGKALTTHIFELLANKDAPFSVCPERVAEQGRMRETVEKRNRIGETDEAVHSFEDTDRVDLDQVEPTMVRGCFAKLKTKRSGSSALGVKKRLKTISDQSAHSSGTCLEPIFSPTNPLLKSIPLNKEKNAALVPNLSTDLQGLSHPADASAFQKPAPQKIMKDMKSRLMEFGQMAMEFETMLNETVQNNENKNKQLGELKLKFQKERQRVSELESQLHNVEAERDRLKAKITKVQSEQANTEKKYKEEKYVRELEHQKAETEIKFESARHFRFGWVQASLPQNKRIVACPDDFDKTLGFEPKGYKFFLGMNRSDRRVKAVSENEDNEKNENEPEDEDDQDEEDEDNQDEEDEDDQDEEDEDDQDEEDEDDQDGEDFNVLGRPPENNQVVSNSLGSRDVDNYPEFYLHPQNSSMIHLETSKNRTYFPPQPNQETSNTTPQQKQTSPLCHAAQINHPVDNNQYVEYSLGRRGVHNNLALSMHPQYMTSQNKSYIPPQLNQETSNPTTQLTIPMDQSINYIPPQSNQETSNTTPQRKQTSPLCHPAQINHLVDNTQYVENSLGRRDVDNNLALSMQPQHMVQAETSQNRSYIPPQLNQGTSNTSSQLTSRNQYFQFMNSSDRSDIALGSLQQKET